MELVHRCLITCELIFMASVQVYTKRTMTATNLRGAPRWDCNVRALGSHFREFNALMTRATDVVIFHTGTLHRIYGWIYLQVPRFARPSVTFRLFRYRILFRSSDQYRFHKVSSVMAHLRWCRQTSLVSAISGSVSFTSLAATNSPSVVVLFYLLLQLHAPELVECLISLYYYRAVVLPLAEARHQQALSCIILKRENNDPGCRYFTIVVSFVKSNGIFSPSLYQISRLQMVVSCLRRTA